jgi:predicted PurR-regulated permease PerM
VRPKKPYDAVAMLLVFAIVVAGLSFAREVLIPLALAVLTSFALGPLVSLLRRARFGRILSVIVTVLLAFLLILGIGALFTSQLTDLAGDLPRYQYNLTDKIRSIQHMTAERGIFGRASMVLEALNNEIQKTNGPEVSPTPMSTPSPSAPPKPLLVEISQPSATPLQIIQAIIQPLLQPLGVAGLVIIFVILFLFKREDLRDRFIRLVGSGDLRRTTAALDDAVGRMSRYLLLQIAINMVFGLFIGIGLWMIGIPNPLLWGVMAMLLRFVPYVGPIIALIFPAALALAVDSDWTMLLWTVGLFLTMEPITGQIVEPLLYGRGTGLSAVAVIVSAAFWTWLWGPIGLLLSTPLTLCLVVLGRHVTRVEFLDVILGDKPALTAEENFYQRMLAGDPDEAAVQAEAYLKENTLPTYYDDVAIKGLALAQLDAARGDLAQEQLLQIKQAVDDLINDLSTHAESDGSQQTIPDSALSKHLDLENLQNAAEGVVLCIAGRNPLDEASAAMLAQLLAQKHCTTRVVRSLDVSTISLFKLDAANVNTAYVCYLDPNSFTNARFLVRRLRRQIPAARIVVGLWSLTKVDVSDSGEAIRNIEADSVVTTLRQAVEEIGPLGGGTLDRIAPVEGKDDIAILSKAL